MYLVRPGNKASALHEHPSFSKASPVVNFDVGLSPFQNSHPTILFRVLSNIIIRWSR